MSYGSGFGDLISEILRAKYFIIIFALLGFVVSLIFLWLAEPRVKAVSMVIPRSVETPEIYDESSALYGFVGIAQDADFIRFEKTVNGMKVAENLYKNKKILDIVNSDKRYKIPFNAVEKIDSPAELHDYLKKEINISNVGTTAFRRIEYTNPDPENAVYLISSASSVADEIIRIDALKEVEKRIAYLENQITKSLNPVHKDHLVRMLMQQEQRKMMVMMNEPYSYIIAEPPAVLSQTAWPKKYIIVPVFVFSAMLGGYFISLFGLGGCRHE